MGEDELDAERREHIGEPVPAAGGFDDGSVGTGKLREVELEHERRGEDAGLVYARAVRALGWDHAVALVLVEAGVPHRSALLG